MARTKSILLTITVSIGVILIGFAVFAYYADKASYKASYEALDKASYEEWRIEEAKAKAEAAIAYKANLELKITDTTTDGKIAILTGTVKNLGDKIVRDLDLVVYLMDAEHRAIGEAQAIIALGWPGLKPNYTDKFLCLFDFLPPGIAGHNFEIKKIKLADD